ncbi:MAG: helix-turn-helix transcriptional regulator [Oscillospiraceae bacterium]|nr:helix-turn-helix transcriptional regulator [Kiritimatiellia bacterium]MDD4511320.1 helix-turn-helix transcriptional regulator [Oscillospiraceae bacterium]
MKTGRPAKTKRTAFGERLHDLREAAGLSQQQVADALGISQPAYALWERRDVAVRIEKLQKLAAVLGTTTEVLLQDNKTAKRRGGPRGRALRIFEQVSQQPRTKQQQILDVVDALLKA